MTDHEHAMQPGYVVAIWRRAIGSPPSGADYIRLLPPGAQVIIRDGGRVTTITVAQDRRLIEVEGGKR